MEIRNTCSLNTTDDRAAGGRAAPRRNAAVWFWLRYFMVLINVLRRSVRLYHECFKAAFKVKWRNFLNWLLVSFWRCWVILSTLLTMTHHKPRYITTNSRPWNVVIEVFGQKYVDIWRPSADEERSCESLVEIGLNVNLNKKQQLVIIIIILFFFSYLCELQRATAQDCVQAFVSVKKSKNKKLYFDVQLHYDIVISTQNYSNITVMYCVFLHQPH